MVNFAVEGIGDGSGFFADNNTQYVKLFAHADGGTVTEAEVGVDVESRGDGEDAAGGEDEVSVGDDGAVVEGRVFEEERFEEWRGGEGVDTLAGGDKVVDLVAAFEDDEGTSLGLRHVHAGVDVGFVVD